MLHWNLTMPAAALAIRGRSMSERLLRPTRLPAFVRLSKTRPKAVAHHVPPMLCGLAAEWLQVRPVPMNTAYSPSPLSKNGEMANGWLRKESLVGDRFVEIDYSLQTRLVKIFLRRQVCIGELDWKTVERKDVKTAIGYQVGYGLLRTYINAVEQSPAFSSPSHHSGSKR